jgi:16S rRNA (cytosine967-C5)-methyltransferase
MDRGTALDEALDPLTGKLAGSRDRALARRLANALMHDWPAVQCIIARLLKRRPSKRDRLVEFVLAVALLELRQAREPGRAVVHAAVESIALSGLIHLRGLVNAVLRNYQRRKAEIDAGIPDDPEHRFGYPTWLVDRIRADWPDGWQEILIAGNSPPPLWLRVNRRHWSVAEAQQALAGAGAAARQIPELADALILEHRAAVSELPGFEEGGLSVQDGAAQATVEHLRLQPGHRVLDACAAPGGKSAHILEREDVELTALDVSDHRLARVRANFQRLGLKARVIAGDATCPEQWWDREPFDRILIDAPCSATGVIRRHPDIRWLRRASDLGELVQIQAQMLESLWPLLKPGGILVYATCSILNAENEAQAERFQNQHADARILQRSDRPGLGHQIQTGQADMDGFYHLAVERLPGRA